MTADDFRALVLAHDGAVEAAHMGHPDFRANGRIFASLHTADRFGMVKIDPAEQGVLLREHPESFTPSPGAWGRQGCTNVVLGAANKTAVRGAIRLAFDAAMAKPPAKPKIKTTPGSIGPRGPRASGVAKKR